MIRIIILILGLCGFMVAKHIRDHKMKDKPLVCMAGFDCHAVVHSDYSRFFGMPTELLGMLYYSLVSVSSVIFILTPDIPAALALALRAVSLCAFLFSLYLIAVQIFILKKGCSWCIVSALISALIFILVLFA